MALGITGSGRGSGSGCLFSSGCGGDLEAEEDLTGGRIQGKLSGNQNSSSVCHASSSEVVAGIICFALALEVEVRSGLALNGEELDGAVTGL